MLLSPNFSPSYRVAKPSIERTSLEYSARAGIGENALSLIEGTKVMRSKEREVDEQIEFELDE